MEEILLLVSELKRALLKKNNELLERGANSHQFGELKNRENDIDNLEISFMAAKQNVEYRDAIVSNFKTECLRIKSQIENI